MSDSLGDSLTVLLSYFPSFIGIRWKEMDSGVRAWGGGCSFFRHQLGGLEKINHCSPHPHSSFPSLPKKENKALLGQSPRDCLRLLIRWCLAPDRTGSVSALPVGPSSPRSVTSQENQQSPQHPHRLQSCPLCSAELSAVTLGV